METETILITGAGSGIGKLTAFVLAKIGKDVIATTEFNWQAEYLKKDAKALNIPLTVEKLDITDTNDRKQALNWDIDILVNNAAVKEGGSLVDIPEENLRNQYEVNVFGTILLTQGFARKMIERKAGRIVFISSVSGLMVNPFSGPYASSKYALEGAASTLSQELQEFNIEVAVINPGPYLTGFNDREFNTWKTWTDKTHNRVFNYEKLAFPFKQINPQKAIAPIVRVILGQTTSYRNVLPKYLIPAIQLVNAFDWLKRTTWKSGKKNLLVKEAEKNNPSSDGGYMI